MNDGVNRKSDTDTKNSGSISRAGQTKYQKNWIHSFPA